MAPLAMFWALVLGSARRRDWRARLRAKPRGDWLLDGSGLAVQGWLIPLLEIVVVERLCAIVAPAARGALALPPLAAFLLDFVAVDYLYYWNHRLLHTDRLWPIHAVHHTVTEMDTLGTARNTLWSSAFIVYLWVNGALVYLLRDPVPYLLAAGVTAALDLWRHSGLQPPPRLARLLGRVLVLPDDHARHHAADGAGNYGANFNLWDRLHRTWFPGRTVTPGGPGRTVAPGGPGRTVAPGGPGRTAAPGALGCPLELSLLRKLFWPFPPAAGAPTRRVRVGADPALLNGGDR